MSKGSLVYVVDDDEAARDSLAALLEAVGLEVRTFESGRAFLEQLGTLRGGCALLDVRMPDLGGLEVQERLAAAGGRIPVIIVTGHADVPMAVKAMKAGAVDFIEKPFDHQILLDSVRRALAPPLPPGHEGASSAANERLAQLTPRERDVLLQLVIGRPNKLIGHALGISPRTVAIHRARVMEKMQAKSLSHLVRMSLAAGIDPQAS